MRRICLIVSLGVLVTVLAACGKGEPVAAPDAGSASSGPTSTVGATTTTASLAAGPFIVTTTTTAAPTTAAPTTAAPTTTAPTTTTTAPSPPTTAAPTTTTSPPAPPTTQPAPTPAAPTAPGNVPATWTVKAGESFWSVAEAVVGMRLGRAPTSAEVDSTWRAIIDANRQNLPNPANPDVLWVGTILTIPP